MTQEGVAEESVIDWLTRRSSDGLLRVDPTGICTGANAAVSSVLGADPSNARGTPCDSLLGVDVDELKAAGESGRTITVAIPGGAADPTVAAVRRLAQGQTDGAAYLVLVQRLPHAPRRLPTSAGVRTRSELIDEVERMAKQHDTLDRIMSLITHDLQAPLRRILSFGQLLDRDRPDVDDATRQNLDYIVDSAQTASRLLAELRNYTRLDDLPGTINQLELGSLVEGVRSDLSPAIEAVEAKVLIDSLPAIRSSPELLRRIFAELIQNALDHTVDGRAPEVTIRGRRDYDVVRIEVIDNGPGVAAAFSEEIFDPFRRLHSDVASHPGIGLAVVRRLVERLGGRVWAAPSDDGATFVVRLPASLPGTAVE